MGTILLVEDDITFSKIVEAFLTRKGYFVETCNNVRAAVAALKRKKYMLLLLDYRLPDGTGLDVIQAAMMESIDTPSIVMTSFNDVRTAVKSLKMGAFDYITKPINQEELLMLMEEAVQKNNPIDLSLQETIFPQFIEGKSEAAQKVQHQIELIGPTDLSVIIQGESGTGKEYAANLIHRLSNRSAKPFLAVDCGTLSAELASSELFGHIKGAFTGALNRACSITQRRLLIFKNHLSAF